ncbi:MAG: hypothetical protein ACKV2O_24445 [Acidimicrobiales bacterium]
METHTEQLARSHRAAERAIAAGVTLRRLAVIVAALSLIGFVLSGASLVSNGGSGGASGAFLFVIFGPIAVGLLHALGCITEVHGHSLLHALLAEIEYDEVE